VKPLQKYFIVNVIYKWHLFRNDKFAEVQNHCSKIHASTPLHCANAWAKIACCSSELIFRFLYASNSIQNPNEQKKIC